MSQEGMIFGVFGQYLKRKDHKTIVNKSKNVLKCTFKFKTTLWDEIDKFVLFKNSTDTYNIHLGTDSTVNCIVPWEVLDGKWFKVTVYGGDLITTNEVTIPLVKSGYTTDITPTKEASRDIFVEIMESLDTKFDEITFEDNSIMMYSNGVLKNTINLPYVDEAYVDTILGSYVTSSELTEILKSYVKDVTLTEDGRLIFE